MSQPRQLTNTASSTANADTKCSETASGLSGRIADACVKNAALSKTENGELRKKPLTHYCVIRRDLPRGLACAQLIHAAGESSDRVPSGTHAIALSVAGEAELHKLAEHLDALDVSYAAVVESDEPYTDQLCAIGIEPITDRSVVRKVVSSLPLVK